jgi:DNA-binding transcriptional regulator YiaG
MAEDDDIDILKAHKAKAKAGFTRARHSLLALLQSDEEIDRKEIRNRQQLLDEKLEIVMTCLDKLSCTSKDRSLVSATTDEIEKISAEYEDAMQQARLCVISSKSSKSSSSSITASESVISQEETSRIREKEQVNENEETQSKLGHNKTKGTETNLKTKNIVKKQHNCDADKDDNEDHNSSLGQDMWKQLKRVTIPVFNGDKRLYENWKASFVACIDSAPATPEYKLLQLRQYLTGDALKAIENLGHSAVAYEAAKQRLERKFGGMRRHIAAQHEQIDNFKPVRQGNAKDLEKFADLLDVTVINLHEVGRSEELEYGSLYLKLLKKLPENLITNYQRWLYENGRDDVVETLREWVCREAEFEMVASETAHGLFGSFFHGSKNYNKYQNLKQQSVTTHFGQHKSKSPPTTWKEKPGCSHCGGPHGIWNCDSFKSVTCEQRWQEAKEKRLCYRCLGNTHVGQACKRTATCGIDGCTKSHHRLLHREVNLSSSMDSSYKEPTTSSSVNSQLQTEEKTHYSTTSLVTTNNSTSKHQYIALRTIPVIVSNGNKNIQINALLDDGSTKTYINADVAAELGLVGEQENVSVNVLNGRSEVFKTAAVDVHLKSLDGSINTTVNAFITTKVTGMMHAIDWQKQKNKWKHLQRVEFPPLGSKREVDMLIGVDYAYLHCARQEVHGEEGQPIARLTPLGWTCVGPLTSTRETSFHSLYSFFQRDETCIYDQICTNLQRFWEIETVKTEEQPLSKQDQQVLSKVKNSLSYKDGSYTVEIPWIAEEKKLALPVNYEMAKRRLIATEQRLAREPEIATNYQKCVEKYIDKMYVKKVDVTKQDSTKRWFLPHFPIVRMDKSTTKVRIVFDASATHKGISLNNAINTGPKLQQELTAVLLRFRKNPVAIICDIEEMYLRIKINEHDQGYFSFLWRDLDTNREPDVYEFSRVVFGVNCSPFLAQFVLREHANLHLKEFPIGATTILKSTYMDDSMDSVEDDERGKELYYQLSELLKRADMHTRKWLSNSVAVRECIPTEDQATSICIDGDSIQGTKALGVLWLTDEDVFNFHFKPISDQFVFTKRNVLKKIATLFDPLGFLTPYTIRAKILLQKMWLTGSDWDEILPSDLQAEVNQWFTELPDVSDVKVPRCLIETSEKKLLEITIHVFVDASTEAYGTVIYVRCVYHDGSISCRLVCSKSHVAPLNAVSIPRLELMAAVLGFRLAISTVHALEMDIRFVSFWSDSMNVLWWLTRQSRIYQPFVANRIGEIQSVTQPTQWHYVPTDMNPADMVSRGARVSELSDCVWLNGPKFLMLSEEQWPKKIVQRQSDALTEIKKKHINAEHECSSFLANFQFETEERLKPDRFSSWKRLLYVCGWTVRFVSNCRLPADERLQGELTCDELIDVERQILKQCQQQAFANEYIALLNNKQPSNKSKLIMLNPHLDEDGLIRSNSRLVQGDLLPFDMRYPIILPRKHVVTKLIIIDQHERNNHVGGINHVLSTLSEKYWIIAGREAVREYISLCAKCKLKNFRGANQMMAPLPAARIVMPATLRAFTHTALDFAGPFETIKGRGKTREKRYLCLFTCMHTRAVHLELAYGLDTDSFLRALQRFIDRRGCPEQLTSDNGRNFVGANRELNELYQLIDHNRVVKTLAVQRIRWNFNPPIAPHFGGVFEIMIKAAKRATYAILSKADVSDEELQSAFVGAEALLNNRPLTYQSADNNDLMPLTPGHFLYGQLGGRCVIEACDVDRPKQRWRRVQELVRHFWQRWIKEWLPSLTSRKKWGILNRDLAVGDVVLVLSTDLVRGHYPLGRIISTYPGKDGHVRVVDVKVGSSILKRAITTLCPLEFAVDNAED